MWYPKKNTQLTPRATNTVEDSLCRCNYLTTTQTGHQEGQRVDSMRLEKEWNEEGYLNYYKENL